MTSLQVTFNKLTEKHFFNLLLFETFCQRFGTFRCFLLKFGHFLWLFAKNWALFAFVRDFAKCWALFAAFCQKWWQKEDDPNSSFRRREIARVLLDLAAELFRFKLNR